MLSRIYFIISDSLSSAHKSVAIPVVADHSQNTRPLAHASNALSVGDQHVLPQEVRSLNTSMRAFSVLTLAAHSRSLPAQAKTTSTSQLSVSARSCLAPDYSALTLQAPQFKEQQLNPTASPCVT